MPRFDRVPLGDARMKTASGKRAQIIAEYVRYIEQSLCGRCGAPSLWRKSDGQSGR